MSTYTPLTHLELNGQKVLIDDIEDINWEGSDDGEGFELADELWVFLRDQEEPLVINTADTEDATLALVYDWIDCV